MAWTPTKNVIDEKAFIPNLMSYLSANQTDALFWANGGTGLEDIQVFHYSIANRLVDIFPSLGIVSSASEESSEDAIEARIVYILEGAVTGSNEGNPEDADALMMKVWRYMTALKSMLKNIPVSTLTAGHSEHLAGFCEVIQTSIDEVAFRGESLAFLQIFQIRVSFTLYGPGQ